MKKLLIIIFIIGGLIMLRPVDAFIKDAIAGIVHRGNFITGIITADNGNKSYAVEISESGKSIPAIFTLSPDPDLEVGDKARVLCRGGTKEDMILLAPTVPKGIICTGDVDTAIYDGVTFDMDSEDGRMQGIYISSDGTKIFVIGRREEKVFQYSLATPWDVSTCSYNGKFFDVSNEDTSLYGLFFKPDGTKMYIVGYVNDAVFQYSLSTAWDVTTASYDSKSGDVSNEASAPRHLFFKPDGSKMYVTCAGNNKVFQYSLSTAWDVSTITYDSKYADTSNEETTLADVFFRTDGDKMYIIGHWDRVFQYTLATPWDVSTASYDNKLYDSTSETYWARALFFRPTGCKMYIMTSTPSVIYQYSIGR